MTSSVRECETCVENALTLSRSRRNLRLPRPDPARFTRKNASTYPRLARARPECRDRSRCGLRRARGGVSPRPIADRSVALFRLDAKRAMLRERALVVDGAIERVALEASLEQFPKAVGRTIADGGVFADLAEESPGFARMLAMPRDDGRRLALRDRAPRRRPARRADRAARAEARVRHARVGALRADGRALRNGIPPIRRARSAPRGRADARGCDTEGARRLPRPPGRDGRAAA